QPRAPLLDDDGREAEGEDLDAADVVDAALRAVDVADAQAEPRDVPRRLAELLADLLADVLAVGLGELRADDAHVREQQFIGAGDLTFAGFGNRGGDAGHVEMVLVSARNRTAGCRSRSSGRTSGSAGNGSRPRP